MAVRVHSQRGICARPALQDAAPALRARGLAVWVMPGPGREMDAEVIVRAARLTLERALKLAPEAEVHWLTAGAATSAAGTEHDPTENAPTEDARTEKDQAKVAPTDEDAGKEADGGRRLPPAGLPPAAGTVQRVSVDLAAGQVLLDGTRVGLTGVEYRVLRYLVENCSRPVGREELQEFLESSESPGAAARSIDVYVGRVRRKLGNARHAVATVRGGGYQFIPGPSATVRGPAEYSI
jgi:two-component system OmpR family response regulator